MSNLTNYSTETNLRSVELQNNLHAVDYFIRRNYLSNLPEYEVVPFEVQATNNIRLYRVDKIIFDEEEDINEKLTSVYGALQNVAATVLIYIKGTKSGVEFYLGGRTEASTAGILGNVLTDSFKANFPGSALDSQYDEEVQALLKDQEFGNITSVTVVPSLREDNEKNFVQGMEKLIDAMRGKQYTALLVASPVSKEVLYQRRLGLEQLYSSISPFSKTTIAYGENESTAVSEGTFTNFSSTVNESLSSTFGSSVSNSTSKSYTYGLFNDRTSGESQSKTYSSSETSSYGTAQSKGYGSNQSTSKTTGSSLTYTVESVDKTIEGLLRYIEEQIERIKACESFGLWETAAYFCSDQIENALMAASTFKALVSGDETYIENAFINVWDNQNAHTAAVAQYLRYCRHPQFVIPGTDMIAQQIVTPGNHISGKELPVFMGIPQKSVAGVTVTSIAEFGRNVTMIDRPGRAKTDEPSSNRLLPLGCIYHKGVPESRNLVNLDLDSLTSHCFICGSTGSGKSNTVACLLHAFIRNHIPFLVIEPAKGEYKNDFGGVPGIHIFNTNPYMGAMLKINPFEFPVNIHVLEHLDRLVEIFNACWEMYAAMPAILKNAMEKAYTAKGWDLQNSVFLGEGDPQFPTFADLLTVLPQVIKTSGYSADTQGDYTGALVTRVQSLANGLCGQIFCDTYYIPDTTLFDENTIVDLSRIGSAETKSLIMGLLVMRLNEYRMATATGSNRELSHVTVLEEAHNLLKNVSQAQGQQSANPVGKSVEMLCNSIAEMRTYGEGFVIIDQSPSAVDIAAIKNTNTKIVMRLPEASDCEAVGRALSLNDAQIKELSKLPVGVAAVLQSNWLETVLCSIQKAPDKSHKETVPVTFEQLRELKSAIVERVLVDYQIAHTLDFEKLRALVSDYSQKINIPPAVQNEILGRLKSVCFAPSNNAFFTSFLHFSGMESIYVAVADQISGRETDRGAAWAWRRAVEGKIRNLYAFPTESLYRQFFAYTLFGMACLGTKQPADFRAVYKLIVLDEGGVNNGD